MALIMGTEMKQFYDDYAAQMLIRGYQMVEDMFDDEWKPKPVKVEGKCCARCVHRYGDKMDYCVRHNYDDNCYRFKLAKGLFLKK